MPRRTFLVKKTICELFAGVGGFRLGFDRLGTGWETTWFSQWEPGKTRQWAHGCYVYHYGNCTDLNGEYHTGDDISTINKNNIPDHNLLVGGFPCQDYSVAHSLSSAKGIEGKKGVLWWQIRDILITKRPPFVLLENVDRLLKSPANQNGRDFGIILTSFAQLGYRVEWRVVNAAEYGAVQRRRRTFIFAYSKNTNYAKCVEKLDANAIISKEGFMAKAFQVSGFGNSVYTSVLVTDVTDIDRQLLLNEGTEQSNNDLLEMTSNFRFIFLSSGYMKDGNVVTSDVTPAHVEPLLLSEVTQRQVDESYYIKQDDIPSWSYIKGAKKIPRVSKSGHEYIFSEGPIAFPDPLDRPARTMLTSEGTKNRSTHVIADPATGRLRILTPIETERIQDFDDDWTKFSLIDGEETEMPARMRRFCMGNALVVSMVTRMGNVLDSIIENE